MRIFAKASAICFVHLTSWPCVVRVRAEVPQRRADEARRVCCTRSQGASAADRRWAGHSWNALRRAQAEPAAEVVGVPDATVGYSQHCSWGIR